MKEKSCGKLWYRAGNLRRAQTIDIKPPPYLNSRNPDYYSIKVCRNKLV